MCVSSSGLPAAASSSGAAPKKGPAAPKPRPAKSNHWVEVQIDFDLVASLDEFREHQTTRIKSRRKSQEDFFAVQNSITDFSAQSGMTPPVLKQLDAKKKRQEREEREQRASLSDSSSCDKKSASPAAPENFPPFHLNGRDRVPALPEQQKYFSELLPLSDFLFLAYEDDGALAYSASLASLYDAETERFAPVTLSRQKGLSVYVLNTTFVGFDVALRAKRKVEGSEEEGLPASEIVQIPLNTHRLVEKGPDPRLTSAEGAEEFFAKGKPLKGLFVPSPRGLVAASGGENGGDAQNNLHLGGSGGKSTKTSAGAIAGIGKTLPSGAPPAGTTSGLSLFSTFFGDAERVVVGGTSGANNSVGVRKGAGKKGGGAGAKRGAPKLSKYERNNLPRDEIAHLNESCRPTCRCEIPAKECVQK